MISNSTHGSQGTSWKRKAGIAVALLGWIICVAITLQRHDRFYFGMDFRSIYASSRCLVAGCDPYSETETLAEFLGNGGTLREAGQTVPPPPLGPFMPNFAGYPPTGLVYVLPVTLLHWPLALHVWLSLAIFFYGFAVFLFADLCADYSPLAANICLAVFLVCGSLPLEYANPSVAAAALCCIAVWCVVRERYPVTSVVLYAFSLILKPHLGLMILLYFLVAKASYRKRALQILGTTALLCVPPLLWVTAHLQTRHWYREYFATLKRIASTGSLSDPGPTNPDAYSIADLQTIVSVVRNDPAFYNHVVWAFCLLLLLAWFLLARRLRPSLLNDLLCTAAISSLSILPVYHRSGDTRLLLLTFPALAMLVRRSQIWGGVGIVLSLALGVMSSNSYLKVANPTFLRLPQRLLGKVWDGRLFTILFERPVASICLVLTFFYLAAMYKAFEGGFEQTHEESLAGTIAEPVRS